MATPKDFDPDAYLAEKKKQLASPIKFKDDSVKEEFDGINPVLKKISMTLPAPARVTSGLRSPAKNARVGGVPNSHHLTGDSLDLGLETPQEALDEYKKAGWEIIKESDHYHLQPSKSKKIDTKGFDPDAYLAEKAQPESQPEQPQFTPEDISESGNALTKNLQKGILGFDYESNLRPDLKKVAVERYLNRRGSKEENDGKIDTFGEAASAANIFSLGSISDVVGAVRGRGGPKKDQTATTAQNWANEVSFNALPKGTALINALFGGDIDTGDKLKGYDENLAVEREVEQMRNQANPAAALEGQALGLFTPQGLPSKVLGVAGKATSLLGKGLAKAAPTLAKTPKAVKAITGGALTGTMGGLGYEAADAYSEGRDVELGKAATIGAAGGAFIPALGGIRDLGKYVASKPGFQAAKSSLTTGDNFAGRFFTNFKTITRKAKVDKAKEEVSKFKDIKAPDEEAIFKAEEKAREAAFLREQEVGKEAVKELPEALKLRDPITAARAATERGREASLALGENYEKVAGKIGEKYNFRKLSPEKLRKEITNILRENDVLDSKGNLLQAEIKKIVNSDRRQLLQDLSKYLGQIRQNPSYRKLRLVVQDLQDAAKHAKVNKTASESILGSLSRTAKESMLESLEKFATKDEIKSLKEVRRLYAENKPLLNEFKKFSSQSPEEIIKSAGSKLPGTYIEELLSKQPQLKSEIAEIVMHNIIQRGTTPAALEKAINGYGRNTLKKVLDQKNYEALEQAERRFAATKQSFQAKALPKELEAKLALNRIVDTASTPEAFTRALDNYGRGNLRNLVGESTFKKVEEAEKAFRLAVEGGDKKRASEAAATIKKLVGSLGLRAFPIVQSYKSIYKKENENRR